METITSNPATIAEKAETIVSMFRFIYNFNPVVFDMAWDPATEKNLHDHFVAKFDGICKQEGFASANAILRFMGALSNDNGRLFSEAIARYIEQRNW